VTRLLYGRRILERGEVDHDVQGRALERRLRQERGHPDIARCGRRSHCRAPLARLEQAAAGARDLEGYPGRPEEGGLDALCALALLLVAALRQLHRGGDTRVCRAVVVHETEEIRAQVLRPGDELIVLTGRLLRRDPRDHRREGGAESARIR